MATPLELIDKDELDDLADLAVTKVVPQDYTVSDAGVGGTLTGTFSFPSETSTTKRAWGDELDRIRYSIFDKLQDEFTISTYSYDEEGSDSLDYGFISCDRLNDVFSYWHYPTERGTRPKTVYSVGPYCYFDTEAGRIDQDDDISVRACCNVEFLFSQMDAKTNPFTLRPGFVIGTIERPYEVTGAGISGLGTSASPHQVSIDYDLVDGHLYGDVYFDWTAPGTTGPVDSGMGFSGWGTGASYQWEQLSGSSWRQHLGIGSVGIKSLIDNTGAGSQTGTLVFSSYVNDSGWTCTGFGIVGVIQFDSVSSADDTEASAYQVIHPRNAAMRSAFHLTSDIYFNDYASGLTDILDLEGLVTKLQAVPPPDPPAGDPVSTFVYNSVDSGVKDLIDDYVHGVSDPQPIYDALVDFFNEKIDGTNLYDTGAWDSVSLRQGTQWLLDLNPVDGLLLKILNRLLWEDAYPAELRRIPETDFSPEDEIGMLVVPNLSFNITSTDGTRGNYFGDRPTGIWVTMNSDENVSPVGLVAGVYVAEAWPQPFFHTFLDQDLPQYYSDAGTTGTSASSLRKASAVISATDDVTEVGEVTVTGRDVSATWPVIKQSFFGSLAYDAALIANGKGYANGQAYVGYWNVDKHHRWVYQGDAVVGAGESTLGYSFTVPNPDGNALMEKMRIEISGNNGAVDIFVGTDVPDPEDPGTYLFSRSRGSFVFPDDFVDESLDPADYYGSPIFFAFKNTSGTSQSLRIITSTFYSLEGEDPPWPEPLFFPRYDTLEEGRYRMALERSPTGLTSNDSYRFTPFNHTTGFSGQTGRAMPIPDRGYCVTHIIVEKRPVNGVVPTTGLSAIRIGIMAGHGVVAGAQSGVYPGEFIEFTEIAVDGARAIETVFWPVLEGCPLAYQNVGDQDHIVKAVVNFQPGVNVEFVPHSENMGTASQQGGYYGRAFFAPHFGFAHNLNSGSLSEFGDIALFPMSATCFTQLNQLLTLLPDI